MSPRRAAAAGPLRTAGYVGNLGCIRFPQPVRKAAGIKRGDRLLVVRERDAIALERIELPPDVDADVVEIEGCACEQPPEQCSQGPADVVTVGWSYVQLQPDAAATLGLLPGRAVRLISEPSRITIELDPTAEELDGVDHLRCPP